MQILFITSNRIGDAILSTGLLAHLGDTHPGARITVACGPLAAPLFEHAPGVEAVYVFRKEPYKRHWLKLLRAVSGTRWDLVIDLRASGIAWLVRARVRRRLRPNRTLPRVVHLASVLGLAHTPPAPRLWPGAEARRNAERLVPDGRVVLAIGPTANWAPKMWPAERFAEFVRRITGVGGALEGADVMVQGGPGERDQCRPVLDAIPPERLIDQIGSDLNAAAAALERVRLYVGNDSGLMHLAAASGAPTLGLFGPTPADLYSPWGDHAAIVQAAPRDRAGARGLFRRRAGTMEDVSVDAALDAAAALLARSAESPRFRSTVAPLARRSRGL
jgi:heptosyltransferase III